MSPDFACTVRPEVRDDGSQESVRSTVYSLIICFFLPVVLFSVSSFVVVVFRKTILFVSELFMDILPEYLEPRFFALIRLSVSEGGGYYLRLLIEAFLGR